MSFWRLSSMFGDLLCKSWGLLFAGFARDLFCHIPKFFASADAVGKFFIHRSENSVALSAHLHFIASENFGNETLELAEAVHFLDVLTEKRNDAVENVDVETREAASPILLPDIPALFSDSSPDYAVPAVPLLIPGSSIKSDMQPETSP